MEVQLPAHLGEYDRQRIEGRTDRGYKEVTLTKMGEGKLRENKRGMRGILSDTTERVLGRDMQHFYKL